jgi:hypothetical protein
MMNKAFSNFRVVVSILLLLSFTSPWIRVYSDIFPWGPPIFVNGFHELFGIFWMFTQPGFFRDSLSDIRFIGSEILIAIGLTVLLSYSVSNLILALRHRGYVANRKKSLRNVFLLFLSIVSVLLSISFSLNSCVDWGSWAVVMSIGLAISIELMITLNLIEMPNHSLEQTRDSAGIA